jgi:hypothetical protein
MSDELAIKYPISVEVKVHMENGEQLAYATVGGPIGRVPTHEEILQIIADARSYSVVQGFKVVESPQRLMNLKATEVYGTQVFVPVEEKAFCYTEDELPPPRQPALRDEDDDDDWE